MRPAHLAAFLICAAPFAAYADKRPIEAACDARGLLDEAGCSCLQSLAETDLRDGLHDLIADHLGRKVNIAKIAAERGHSGAEALWDAHAAFHRKAEAECALPKPK